MEFRIHFNVNLADGLPTGGFGHAQLTVVLGKIRGHRRRKVRRRSRLAGGIHLDEHISAFEFGRQRECMLVPRGRELHEFRRIRLDGRELTARSLHERARAEEQFDIHQVIVHLHGIEILPGQVHSLSVDRDLEPRFGRCELTLCLTTVFPVDQFPALPFDFVDLCENGPEGIPPPINGVELVGRRDGARLLWFVLE